MLKVQIRGVFPLLSQVFNFSSKTKTLKSLKVKILKNG
jgi:hypothetical protein